MNEEQTLALLTKIDTTTTHIGGNITSLSSVVQAEADTVQTVSDEFDALIALIAANSNIPQSITDAAQALADKLQASSDTSDLVVGALNAQATALTAIAAKGQPVVPTPPPTPVITPS